MEPIKLSDHLEYFFNDRLIKQKNVSLHTIRSYSKTFQMLFEYASRQLKKAPSQLTLQDLNAHFVSHFLNDLEKRRKICPRTRNIRLAAIKSFFRFLERRLPEMSDLISQVLDIPNKRSAKKLIDFLTNDEVDAVLNAPDQKDWVGKRDHAILLIAIQTGARLSELRELKWKKVHFEERSYIEYLGKGRKERRIPLSVQSSNCLQTWAREVEHFSSDVVFPTIRGKKMSPDAFLYLVKKYAQIAATKCPSLVGKKVTPHILRHTAAMRMVQSKIDLASIAMWLGHESIKTTYVYLNANMEMKEKILKKLPPLNTKTARYKPSDPAMKFLKKLTEQCDGD